MIVRRGGRECRRDGVVIHRNGMTAPPNIYHPNMTPTSVCGKSFSLSRYGVRFTVREIPHRSIL